MSQRYVIMLDQVFTWEEKAPFVPSGKSVFGALEYNRETGKLKCHECGEWHKHLGLHVARKHEETRGYRVQHGLRLQCALTSPQVKRPGSGRLHVPATLLNAPEFKARRVAARIKVKKSISSHAETVNMRGHCPVQVIAKMRETAARLGRTPTGPDLPRDIHLAAIGRYGSWSKACEAAGLEIRTGRGYAYTQAVLVEGLRDFWARNQRLPKAKDWGNGSLPFQTIYRRVFGSLMAAYEAAGLAVVAEKEQWRRVVVHSQPYTDEQLLEALKIFWERNQRLPGKGDYGGESLPSRTTYAMHFDSPRIACAAAGLLEPGMASEAEKHRLIAMGRRYTTEELRCSLKEFYARHNRLPREREDFLRDGLAAYMTYCRRFGSMAAAYVAAGIPAELTQKSDAAD